MTKKLLYSEGGMPNASQILLLKSALFERSEALLCWDKWAKSESQKISKLSSSFSDFVDSLDMGSKRILPLVYKNLFAIDSLDGKPPQEVIFTDETIKNSLKGLLRYTFVNNQRIFNETLRVINYLRENNIEAILMKGIPYTDLYYSDTSVRMMSDGDVLIPLNRREEVLKILCAGDFLISPSAGTIAYNKKYDHGVNFRTTDGVNIDIHWNVFYERADDDNFMDRFWSDAQLVKTGRYTYKTLSHTHHFFVALAHARIWNPVAPIRWVADCYKILQTHQPFINWREIVSLSKHYKFSPFVWRALLLLKTEFSCLVPDSTIEALALVQDDVFEQRYHYYLSKPKFDFRKKPFAKTKLNVLAKHSYYRLYKGEGFVGFICWYAGFAWPRVKKRIMSFI